MHQDHAYSPPRPMFECDVRGLFSIPILSGLISLLLLFLIIIIIILLLLLLSLPLWRLSWLSVRSSYLEKGGKAREIS